MNIPDTIDTFLDEVLDKYVANYNLEQLGHRQSGQQTIKQAITAKINEIEKEAYKKAIDYFYWRIDCSTLISELEGWRGCIDNAKDQTERHFAAELRKRKDEVL